MRPDLTSTSPYRAMKHVHLDVLCICKQLLDDDQVLGFQLRHDFVGLMNAVGMARDMAHGEPRRAFELVAASKAARCQVSIDAYAMEPVADLDLADRVGADLRDMYRLLRSGCAEVYQWLQ